MIKAMHMYDGAERSPLQRYHQRADRGTATTHQICLISRDIVVHVLLRDGHAVGCTAANPPIERRANIVRIGDHDRNTATYLPITRTVVSALTIG